MFSQIVAVVLVAFAAVAVDGASFALADGYNGKILGPVKYPFKDAKTGKVGLRQSIYLPIIPPSPWRTLDKLCKDAFGTEDATMLYIETVPELDAVIDALEPTNPEAFYWIGGEWNSNSGQWEWHNGVPIGDAWNNTWDNGHPGFPTPLSKILLHTVGGYHFQTDFESSSHSYICELDLGQQPCIVDSDLVVLIDGSGSVTAPGFELAKQFVANLTDVWLENDQNRISLIVFGTTATTEFSLDNGLSASELKAKINSVVYPGGGTNTHLGLELAFGEFTMHNRTLPQNMVLLTDGYSSSPTLTLQQAQLIIDAGVVTFAVGVGSSTNPAELLAVAGNNQDHVFSADAFEGLVDVLEKLQEGLCT